MELGAVKEYDQAKSYLKTHADELYTYRAELEKYRKCVAAVDPSKTESIQPILDQVDHLLNLNGKAIADAKKEFDNHRIPWTHAEVAYDELSMMLKSLGLGPITPLELKKAVYITECKGLAAKPIEEDLLARKEMIKYKYQI